MDAADTLLGSSAARIAAAACAPVPHFSAILLQARQPHGGQPTSKSRLIMRGWNAPRVRFTYLTTIRRTRSHFHTHLALSMACFTWFSTCTLSRSTLALLKLKVRISEAVAIRFGRFRCNASRRGKDAGSNRRANLRQGGVGGQPRATSGNEAAGDR